LLPGVARVIRYDDICGCRLPGYIKRKVIVFFSYSDVKKINLVFFFFFKSELYSRL